MEADIRSAEELAAQLVALQSFQYGGFPEAEATLVVMGAPNDAITYDRMSLCVYRHTFGRECFRDMEALVAAIFRASRSGEEVKRRKEYETLWHYATLCPSLWRMKIEKTVRPDFRLEGGERIGVEVTEFTARREGLRLDAAKAGGRRDPGSGWTAYDGLVLSDKRDGLLAEDFKRKYADDVLRKVGKYEGMFAAFDRFIILCDARREEHVARKKDCDDIASMARAKRADARGSTLCILRQTDGVTSVDQYAF